MRQFKTLNFQLKRKSLSIVVLLDGENVITGRYEPNIVYHDIGLFREQSCVDLSEFVEDCQFQINYITDRNLDETTARTYILALNEAVTRHIEKYGRIFYVDLKEYIDICCDFMRAVNLFDNEQLEEIYPNLVCYITRHHNEDVKYGSPFTGIINFSDTALYNSFKRNLSNTASQELPQIFQYENNSCYLNAKTQQLAVNVYNNLKRHPVYMNYQVVISPYNSGTASIDIDIYRKGQSINSQSITRFMFCGDYTGELHSIAIFGIQLDGHLRNIKSSMKIFGLDVKSVNLDTEGFSPFVDVIIKR